MTNLMRPIGFWPPWELSVVDRTLWRDESGQAEQRVRSAVAGARMQTSCWWQQLVQTASDTWRHWSDRTQGLECPVMWTCASGRYAENPVNG